MNNVCVQKAVICGAGRGNSSVKLDYYSADGKLEAVHAAVSQSALVHRTVEQRPSAISQDVPGGTEPEG
jgi:hypothetical protein